MSHFQRARLTKKQLAASLPEDGEPGLTAYCAPGSAIDVSALSIDRDAADEIAEIAGASPTGGVLMAAGGVVMLITPPFPITDSVNYSEVHARPLVELLEQPRSYAVFLLRLGGFSVGFFRGTALVDSKTDQRFVKNRNRKGGQSQRRFERIREKQIDELFAKACETARENLEPYASEIEHVFLGGDRGTIAAFRKECSYFERFGDRLMTHVLHVPGDPRHATLESMPREVWSSDVWTLAADAGA